MHQGRYGGEVHRWRGCQGSVCGRGGGTWRQGRYGGDDTGGMEGMPRAVWRGWHANGGKTGVAYSVSWKTKRTSPIRAGAQRQVE